MNEDQKVKIKKSDLNMELSRSSILDVKETSDGIVFELKHGIHVHITDQYMSVETKVKIKTAVYKIMNVNLEINLDSYDIPVKAIQ